MKPKQPQPKKNKDKDIRTIVLSVFGATALIMLFFKYIVIICSIILVIFLVLYFTVNKFKLHVNKKVLEFKNKLFKKRENK